MILKQNQDLHNFIQYLTDKINQLSESKPEDNLIISSMPTLLKALITSFKDNLGRKKHGKRYKDELIKNFSTFSRDLGGKQVYEFWSQNLPLPSISGVAYHSKNVSAPVVEGEFRFRECVEYCDERKIEREVIICEDGTRIKGKPELDPKTNQIIGFVPELDENGLPAIHSFDASTVESIEKHFSTGKCSNYAYVIMAQPLADVPPFCLAIFGTDNKFTGSQVSKRWEWMISEGKKHGLIIKGFGSDGDTRLHSTMKRWTFSKSENVLPGLTNVFFSSMETINLEDEQQTFNLKPLSFQDIIHILAKLKAQLLKERTEENFWPMGGYVVSGRFLHILINERSKFEHGLTKCDLEEDKMNFRAVQKIVDERVVRALDFVPAANATKCYLIAMKGIMDSFLDKDLDSTQRVYLMWKSVFFFRFWRLWLKENNYKACNFLTSNTYSGIEISAHSLVNMIRRLRDQKKPHLFLDWLMSSQPCEGFFRDGRSCTSSGSTIVNMTIKEFLQRTRKLGRLAEVGQTLSEELIMPRHHKKMQLAIRRTENLRQEGLSSDAELIDAISRAQRDALEMTSSHGMKFDGTRNSIPNVPLKLLCLVPKKDKKKI